MRWRILDPSAPECGANDAGNDHSRSKGPEWSLCAKKHAVDGDLWACMFYVVQNRVSGILWQRQTDIPASFTPHQQRGLLPIDISWAHAGDVASPEPKSKQHQYDRTVSQPLRPVLATGVNEASHLLGVEVPGQRGKPPFGHGWQCMVETRLACATCCQES